MAEYIEREALLERLKFKRNTDRFTNKRYAGLESAIAQVKKATAADVVEVRHGEWGDNHNGTFTCSVCGGQSSKMDYCGRCGAKMDGGKSNGQSKKRNDI